MLIFIGVIVLDSKAVSSSLSWCKEYSEAAKCSYSPFFGMIIIEFIVTVLWCVLGVGLCYYCAKHLKTDTTDFAFDYEDFTTHD